MRGCDVNLLTQRDVNGIRRRQSQPLNRSKSSGGFWFEFNPAVTVAVRTGGFFVAHGESIAEFTTGCQWERVAPSPISVVYRQKAIYG